MRKLQELLALAGLMALWGIPVDAMRNGLPGRIPLHFDLAGNPNRWGSASGIFLLPMIGTGMYLLLTIIVLFPGSFNYPVKVTEQNRARLQGLAIDMTGWLKVELLGSFAYMGWWTIQIARRGQLGGTGLGAGIAPVIASVMVVTITAVGHALAMRSGGSN